MCVCRWVARWWGRRRRDEGRIGRRKELCKEKEREGAPTEATLSVYVRRGNRKARKRERGAIESKEQQAYIDIDIATEREGILEQGEKKKRRKTTTTINNKLHVHGQQQQPPQQAF